MMSAEKKGFLKGTVIGAVVGGVAALLLAPKSGKETQADIKRKVGSLKHDVNKAINDVQSDLKAKIDDLKVVAKDLQGEAAAESQELIRRAELLKMDLQVSASNLARVGAEVKDNTLDDARRLVSEGTGVMTELERLTKKMVGSAKDKVRRDKAEDA